MRKTFTKRLSVVLALSLMMPNVAFASNVQSDEVARPVELAVENEVAPAPETLAENGTSEQQSGVNETATDSESSTNKET